MNSFRYSYQTRIILFRINHLLAYSLMVLTLTIQFNFSNLFALCEIVKQLYLTLTWNSIRYCKSGHSGSGSNGSEWGTAHSLDIQDGNGSLTIRYSLISYQGHLLGVKSSLSTGMLSAYSSAPYCIGIWQLTTFIAIRSYARKRMFKGNKENIWLARK